MKITSPLQKLGPSLVLVILTFIITSPFYFLGLPVAICKFTAIAIFFLFSILSLLVVKDGRDIGMMLFGTFWEERYSIKQKMVYSLLYTASFATVLYWLVFPFDLLLLNLLLLQLPCVLLTGTTLHGYLSGGMRTVTSINESATTKK